MLRSLRVEPVPVAWRKGIRIVREWAAERTTSGGFLVGTFSQVLGATYG